jgi:dUTP pyrophosphatase
LSHPIKVKRLPGNEDLILPRKMSDLAAGFDIHAAVKEPFVLLPGERAVIPTGIAIELPFNLEAQVRPRSGWALHHGITALNSPGTIDADYRGEIGVILINHGKEPFTIQRNDRIAQLVIQEVLDVHFVEADELSPTVRGVGGFGSSNRTKI